MGIQFAPATKKQAKARVALEGPSGSGKTYTSLRIAAGLGGRIALLDTEHGSAAKYADEFAFDTMAIDRYNPATLIEALAVAGSAGYDVFIVDSLSHFWMGVDGMLEQVDRAAKRSGGGNSFAGWKDAAPVERRMIDAILAYPGHVIATMRSKTEWVIEENDRGKKVPRKIGLKAVQRDGIEYEFDIVGDLDQENTLVISKSRCKALSGEVIRQPDEDLGRLIGTWLDSGVSAGPGANDLRDQACTPGLDRAELLALYKQAGNLGLLGAPVVDDTGEPTTLGELIAAKGREVSQRPAPTENTGPEMITEPQSTRLHLMLGKAGITDRDEKLKFYAAVIYREVASSKELTKAEAKQVMDALEEAAAEPVGAEPVGANA